MASAYRHQCVDGVPTEGRPLRGTLLDDPNAGRAPPFTGRWRDRFRFVQALLVDGSLVLVGTLAHVRVADDVRAGMEVMSPKGFGRAGGERARRCSQTVRAKDRADPRRSHQEAAMPRLPSPARFRSSCERHSEHGGIQPCRRCKPPPTKVIYGVNELDLDLAGKTVRGIWKVLEQVLNIPRDAAVSVNGDRADDDYVVHPGDEIEFQKQAGVKGQAV